MELLNEAAPFSFPKLQPHTAILSMMAASLKGILSVDRWALVYRWECAIYNKII
jgi:hypothetical protein